MGNKIKSQPNLGLSAIVGLNIPEQFKLEASATIIFALSFLSWRIRCLFRQYSL